MVRCCSVSNWLLQDESEGLLSSHVIFSPNDYKAATSLVQLADRLGNEIDLRIRQISLNNIEVSTGCIHSY